MLIVGLTGGIATGKSTVSRRLKEHYLAAVVDADVIAREVVEPGKPAYNAIVDHFGGVTPHLLKSDGSKELDRAALGRTVFGNEEHRKKLNSIVHPAVRKAIAWEVIRYWLRGFRMVFLDVPLLFESNLDLYCGLSVAVLCDETKQLQRLKARDPHLSAADAEQRIAAQMPLQAKRRRADLVINNDLGLDELYTSVDNLVRDVQPPLWRTCLQLVLPIGLLWGLFVHFQRKRRLNSV